MPASGVRFQWRSDGFYRDAPANEVVHLGDEDWTGWEDDVVAYSRSEVVPGDRADATWWLSWGLADPTAQVTCWLADNIDVPVARLGWLWIAERVSTAQPMFVAIAGEVTELQARRPHYHPPAEHPFTRTAPDPRAAR